MSNRTYEESIRMLQRCHPDRGTSCIRQEKLAQQHDTEVMLDIIVPAYNVEAYIDACIQSILKQKTSYPFRMILVNDGSKDRTGELAEHYKNEKNVLLIHQENRGLSGARNTGLLHTQAKYIMFVDSDDCLPLYAVERLVSQAESTSADIVAGSYCNFRKYRWLRKTYRQKTGILLSELDLKGHAWGKIYRRELFEKVQFPENYYFEDSVMHQIIFPEAKKLLGIKDVIYERRVNQTSITHTSASNPKRLDSLWVTLKLMQDRDRLGLAVTQTYYEYILNQIGLTHMRLVGLGIEIQKAAFTVMAHLIAERFLHYAAKDESKKGMEQAIRALDFKTFDACFKHR